jgi:hypothetical protein
MSSVVSPLIPFPNIGWWYVALQSNSVIYDTAEHFQKMSYRNRYKITGANGMIQLSAPIEGGRESRAAMRDIHISNKDRWQVQHWRTLTSVYKRSPYFDFYEPTLQALFEQRFEKLVDFNLASIHWLKEQLEVSFPETFADEYIPDYGNDIVDLRHKQKARIQDNKATYYQLFSDRNGFLPNLSMLDLLFSEGPYSRDWINENKEDVIKWNRG